MLVLSKTSIRTSMRLSKLTNIATLSVNSMCSSCGTRTMIRPRHRSDSTTYCRTVCGPCRRESHKRGLRQLLWDCRAPNCSYEAHALRQCIKQGYRDQIKGHQLIGLEFQDDIYALAVSNMVIHGDGKTNIFLGDCFQDSSQIIQKHNPKCRPTQPTVQNQR